MYANGTSIIFEERNNDVSDLYINKKIKQNDKDDKNNIVFFYCRKI